MKRKKKWNYNVLELWQNKQNSMVSSCLVREHWHGSWEICLPCRATFRSLCNVEYPGYFTLHWLEWSYMVKNYRGPNFDMLFFNCTYNSMSALITLLCIAWFIRVFPYGVEFWYFIDFPVSSIYQLHNMYEKVPNVLPYE